VQIELMGGTDSRTPAPLVNWFQELVVRGFLAVREHRAEILALVEPMLASTLVCFMPHSLAGLRARFFPTYDERGAAEQMHAVVYDATDKWTTNTYDWIQAKQQGVFYYAAGTSAHDPQKKLRDVHADELDA
jgi:phosphatidylinositol 4-kinase